MTRSDGELLSTTTFESIATGKICKWESIQLKVEPMTNPHYLPYNQCSACLEVGAVHIYPDKQYKWVFYCADCHTHWYNKYTEVEK